MSKRLRIDKVCSHPFFARSRRLGVRLKAEHRPFQDWVLSQRSVQFSLR